MALSNKGLSFGQVVKKWKLNMPILARKTDIGLGTFKNKVNDSIPKYRFTEVEQKKLVEALNELISDIQIINPAK